jgi:HEAT repeat protein
MARHSCSFSKLPLRLLAFAAALAGFLLADSARAQSEAIKDLRDALAIGASDLEVSAQNLEYRRKALEGALAELKTVNDLYEALVLPDWKDAPRNLAVDIKLLRLDREMHTKVKNRLLRDLRAGLKHKGSKRASAAFINEMGVALRTGTVSEPFGVLRELAPDVLALTKDANPEVRAAAATALGKINPIEPPDADTGKEVPQKELQAVSAALGKLLLHDEIGPRRAAAAALGDLIRTMTDLEKTELTQTLEVLQRKEFARPGGRRAPPNFGIRPRDVVETAQAMVRLAGQGAADADTEVRLRCLQAIALASSELEKMLPAASDYFKDQLKQAPFPKYLFTPKYRPTASSPAGKQIVALREQLRKDLGVYQPLINVLGQQGEVLAAHVEDLGSPEIRLVTRKALEAIASARLRIQHLWEWLPSLQADKDGGEEGGAVSLTPAEEEAEEMTPLLKGLTPALDHFAKGLTDPNPKIRLAAAEFLEMLGRAAEPAVPALVKALCDPEPFVRWTTARTLTHIAPYRPNTVVPALAKALSDPDLDARVAVAEALERYGRMAKLMAAESPDRARQVQTVLARDAVPALARSTQVGDTEARVAAIRAITAVVDGNADMAVDALIAALSNPDVRVRRGAADALGRVPGRAARRALPALQDRLTNDSDDEVRRLASASLLTIEEQLRQQR